MDSRFNHSTGGVAVVYCRVSSFAQTQKGHGLDSQETRCREYARSRGYVVEEVFVDEAVSGSLIDRPGIRAMLKYLRARKGKGQYVALIDDISRLARDMRAHIELRSAIASTGARLESPSIEFGEGSDKQLVEYLLASVSQHQREKNAEQVRNRMGARLTAGYWPFAAPTGYRQGGREKGLVRNEPIATAMQEAMEGFASGVLRTQAEVVRFLETHPAFPVSKHGQISHQLVPRLLSSPIYAGYVEKPDWGIELRKGRHDGLVSFATFERIQERLQESSRSVYKSNLADDFPLRGHVACADCGKVMTASWSTSKTGTKHAYYMCFGKGCLQYRKSIRRDRIEGEFGVLLDALTPSAGLSDMLHDMMRHAWDRRAEQAVAARKIYRDQAATIDRQVDSLLDRLADASVKAAASAYERRIGELEREKLKLIEKADAPLPKAGTFREMFELAFRFVSNPSKLWKSGHPQCRKLVLRLVFTDKLDYSVKEGLSNPKTTMPFSMLGNNRSPFERMAERMGFEPTRPF